MKGKNCFVIMGYGEKTDPINKKKLNLDKTYENVIKPAVESLGIKCKRADEIIHSGTIDSPMYKYLLNADIVIADLSTDNSNAIYELGIRHALRPHTTVVIAENDFKYPFDLSHIVIRKYQHLGEDIGYSEVLRFQEELKVVIKEILENPNTDSPVYTYLEALNPPFYSDVSCEGEIIIPVPEEYTLKGILGLAEVAMDEEKDFIKAKQLFFAASQLDKSSEYIIQKLVLATYKNPIGNKKENLTEALTTLDALAPEKSNDPETLGLSGAIYKRLWEETAKKKHLDKSLFFYERGFYIKQDYYNGINLAFLLNLRATLAKNLDDYITDFTLAKRIREKVVVICKDLFDDNFTERSNKYWILATLEEAYYGLKDIENYELYRDRAIDCQKPIWGRSSTEKQIKKLDKLLEFQYK